MMGKGQAAVSIIDRLNKLGAINAVEWRKEEGITFTESFIAFMKSVSEMIGFRSVPLTITVLLCGGTVQYWRCCWTEKYIVL